MKSEALEGLFKKHYNEARLYVFSLCRDMSLAEDIVSESFYKAFTSIDEERDSFKYWLLKVCRNRYIDYIRKNRRLTQLSDNQRSDDDDIASGLIKDEEYQALYRAISLLQENYREVIMLYYFDGLTVSQIAGVTEQSVENVKVQMYRARLKLKRILED